MTRTKASSALPMNNPPTAGTTTTRTPRATLWSCLSNRCLSCGGFKTKSGCCFDPPLNPAEPDKPTQTAKKAPVKRTRSVVTPPVAETTTKVSPKKRATLAKKKVRVVKPSAKKAKK